MNLNTASAEALSQWATELKAEFERFRSQNLNLDLTRGKPSSDQLTLSNNLDGILKGDYTSPTGVDTRNYGGLEGLPELRKLGAEVLGTSAEQVLAQGNSSLTLMFLAVLTAKDFGLRGDTSAWKHEETIKFLCPVPGYDRHFSICEQFGIEMVTVAMTATGPDMDQVEAMLKADSSIKGMWCVPKYSNPTGVVYSNETVERIANLGNIAGANFCVFWDNAYAVHDLDDTIPLASISEACQKAGTEDSVIQFASTSKITHAGSGVAFVASSAANIAGLKKVFSILSIGPDKVNQLRHLKLIPDYASLVTHMQAHAALLKPRFASVLNHLEEAFGGSDLGQWESVAGGYFVSFDTQAGLAKKVVALAAELGVKLTPAGATFPYGNDPEDRNIRIAPSVPTLEQVDAAMKAFVLCVKLASVEKVLAERS